MFKFITKLLDTNAKEITKLQSIVDSINAQEDAARKLKETDFKKKTAEFRVAKKLSVYGTTEPKYFLTNSG